MFVEKFEAADADHNLLLTEDEFSSSFEDMAQLRQISEDKFSFKRLVSDMSGRQDMKVKSVNFFEWMFVRRCAIAWGIAESR